MHGEWGSASLYGDRRQSPLGADDVFVSETLIFDAPAIVINQISTLMIHMLPFNVAQHAFKDTHCNNTPKISLGN